MICIGDVQSWSTDNPSWRNDYPVDMVDEHYYRNPTWFAERFYKYDSYPRDSHKVYVGEYTKLEPAISVCPQQIASGKYSYRVQTMKESGMQGFLMLVGYADELNYQWYNVAGWDNTVSSVEQTLKGSKSGIAPQKRFRVENNRWYDLRIDVDEDSLHCYIDGRLDFACKLQKGLQMEGVFASTTIDEPTNTMYVKVVNLGEGFAPGVINLKNCRVDTRTPEAVTLTQLAAENGTDENTQENPQFIYPKCMEITSGKSSDRVSFDVAPFSVSILKIKLK